MHDKNQMMEYNGNYFLKYRKVVYMHTHFGVLCFQKCFETSNK